MPVVGFMPVVKNGASDLGVRIWGSLGFFIAVLLLLWPELEVWVKSTVLSNKFELGGQDLWSTYGVGGHPLAGCGSEERTQAAVLCSAASSWWRNLWILQTGVVISLLAGRGGGGNKKINFLPCRSGDWRSGDADVAAGGDVISTGSSPLNTLAEGQPPFSSGVFLRHHIDDSFRLSRCRTQGL